MKVLPILPRSDSWSQRGGGYSLFGPVVGVALGVIGFLSAFDSIAGNRVYQGILGWSSWLMPMTWMVTAVGLIMFVINLVVAGVTGNQWAPAKISSIGFDWSTGTFYMSGGLIQPLGATGFNMGHFIFLTPGSTALQHELGHTLSLAAYGWAFHYIGALDENISGSAEPMPCRRFWPIATILRVLPALGTLGTSRDPAHT